MRTRRTLEATLLSSLLSFPGVLLAQAPAAVPHVAGSVETSILELEIVVTDRDGRRVTGLQAADFEVRIGGKATAIASFFERRPTPVAAPPGAEAAVPAAAPDAAPTAPAASRPPRHVVLFVDRLQLIEKWKADATFDGLRAVLRQTVVAPGDDAMIVTWNRSVGSVVPFTSDVAAIERVLAREEKLCRRPLETDSVRRQLEEEAAWFRSLPTSSVSSGVEVSQRAAAAEAYAQMRAKSNALKAVFSTLGGLPGRKIVVHASHRFSDLAGLEFFLTGPVMYGSIPGDAREFNAHGIVESVAEAANANGVTMYTFFPEGWNEDAMPLAPGLSDAEVHNEGAALEVLADRTGGTFSLGWREGPALAARVVEDVESSYSLGVAASGRKPGASQAVKVTVRNPSLTVRARRTALERTPEERVEARVLSNLFRPEPPSRLRLSLDSASVEAAKKKATATLHLRVPIAGLVKTPTARGASGAFSVFVVSAGADGSFSEVVRQRRPFEIPKADADRASAGHFTYEVPVVVGAGEARISVGVWDEVGKDAGFLLVEVRDGQASVRR